MDRVSTLYIKNIALAAEYCRLRVKGIGPQYRVCIKINRSWSYVHTTREIQHNSALFNTRHCAENGYLLEAPAHVLQAIPHINLHSLNAELIRNRILHVTRANSYGCASSLIVLKFSVQIHCPIKRIVGPEKGRLLPIKSLCFCQMTLEFGAASLIRWVVKGWATSIENENLEVVGA